MPSEVVIQRGKTDLQERIRVLQLRDWGRLRRRSNHHHLPGHTSNADSITKSGRITRLRLD